MLDFLTFTIELTNSHSQKFLNLYNLIAISESTIKFKLKFSYSVSLATLKEPDIYLCLVTTIWDNTDPILHLLKSLKAETS